MTLDTISRREVVVISGDAKVAGDYDGGIERERKIGWGESVKDEGLGTLFIYFYKIGP